MLFRLSMDDRIRNIAASNRDTQDLSPGLGVFLADLYQYVWCVLFMREPRESSFDNKTEIIHLLALPHVHLTEASPLTTRPALKQ